MLASKEREIFLKLSELIAPENNSQLYRQVLSSSKPPCVPYLGTHLGDLTYVYECIKLNTKNPDKVYQLNERKIQVCLLI